MKYIRLYEKVVIDIKRYFIWDAADNDLSEISVLENLNIIETSQTFTDKDFLKVKHLYRYDLEKGKLEKIDENSRGCTTGIIVNKEVYEEHKWRILYQTNNLKDCLEQLKIVVSAKQYNL